MLLNKVTSTNYIPFFFFTDTVVQLIY